MNCANFYYDSRLSDSMLLETNWTKKKGRMQTSWFDDVDPNKTFPEYPRPQMVRQNWMNLNGLWEYAITSSKVETIEKYQGQILVPFPVESSLSGVMKPLLPKNRLWYRKEFKIPNNWNKKRVLLHFGAVDWECSVWLNGYELGSHKGGYSSFTFDISEFVSFLGENEIVVKVYDPTDKGRQPYGKQTLKPKTVFYTPTSGIWQTVWLENVSDTYIDSFKIIPDIDNSTVTIESRIIGKSSVNSVISVKITKDGKEITSKEVPRGESITLAVNKPKLWSPESPELYDMKLALSSDGKPLDLVDTYFAMRKFSLENGPCGIPQFFLNNNPYFMIGLLDQGFWPDGLYTAPTDAALLWDVETTKKFGFNMIRKHIKTEPARWYHYCDKLGIIVWQDIPNGGKMRLIPPGMGLHLLGKKLDDTINYRKFGLNKIRDRDQIENEMQEIIECLINVPSIAIWVTFNEAWGQFDAKRIAEWVEEYDSTRLVDHASGWFDQRGGHFVSIHNYNDTFKIPEETNDRGVLLSETGGYTRLLEGNMWNPHKKFGYKTYSSKEELHSAYKNMVIDVLRPAIEKGLSGAVYTQTSDVEIEYNGLVTYNRKVLKLDPDIIKPLNMLLREIFPKT